MAAEARRQFIFSSCLNSFRLKLVIILLVSQVASVGKAQEEEENVNTLPETVLVVILCRNKAHTLPYFLGLLEKLDYPKKSLSLRIRSDRNIDDSLDILQTWLLAEQNNYHSVDFKYEDAPPHYFDDEDGPHHWSDSRFRHIIRLKEEALDAARNMWADFIWFLDADVFLLNNQTLKKLIAKEKTLIAPMLESVGAYSNYWCGMNEKFYYTRTEEYLPILERKKTGCFAVPMIHSSVLVNLRRETSLRLTFDRNKLQNFTIPEDDIITFAISASSSDIKMHVLNEEMFGYIMVPLDSTNKLSDDYEQLTNVKVQILTDHNLMEPSEHLLEYVSEVEKDLLGFDQVYLINLQRRQERRQKMVNAFKELGIQAKLIEAVDGRQLNTSFLHQRGIHALPEYTDPYHKRPMTMGEIGCFLSHYSIWKEVVQMQHRAVIVFEDDIRFEPYFRKRLNKLIYEAQKLSLDWDLIYLGRKRLLEKDEPWVEGSSTIVKVEYSYWTLCYMITLEGAKKLLEADPLPKLVPVDEYLPIMFDKHPEATWKSHFTNRNLKAFSSAPLLVFPTHYTGEKDYISDTEDSETADGNVVQHTEL